MAVDGKLRDMNVCTKFRGNPSNSCQDISPKTTNINIMVALEEMSRDHQSHQD